MDYIKSIEKVIEKWENRINWNEYFMSIALLISSRSSCKRLKVGCVLVKDTRIISVGYNGFLPKAPHISMVRDNHEQATVHAEQNCISDCASRGISCKDSTAFITHYPCINCAKILAASGIKEIFYYNNYKNDELVIKLLENSQIKISKFNEK